MNDNIPLVSCIMPTTDREKFIPLAISYFLRQDYANKELIIIDDGKYPIEVLIPACPQINYIRLLQKNTIGAKRNHACQIANGEFIIHLDDDDWYAPDWISKQMNILQRGIDICGLSQLFFYNPALDKVWKYVYPDTALHWVAGATMAYRKSFWLQYPFKNVQVGEDNTFVWNTNAKVAKTDYLNGFVSILHSNNTSPKYTADSRWKPHPIAGISSILKDDIINYKSI